VVCSVVVVVAGETGRTVVSSEVVEEVVLWGASEAQPEKAPGREMSRQARRMFFIYIFGKGNASAVHGKAHGR